MRIKASLADVSCSHHRSDTEVRANEDGRTVFLTVSRSHGLGSAVSVEWETQSGTAVASGQNARRTLCCFHPFGWDSSVVSISRGSLLGDGGLPELRGQPHLSVVRSAT